MPSSRFFARALIMATFTASLSSAASASGQTPASKLSAALGGTLRDGMSEAGGPGHGKLDLTAELRPARTDVYRRQVAALLAAGRPQKSGVEP